MTAKRTPSTSSPRSNLTRMPAENGYVPTPDPVADLTAAVAFGAERPSEKADGGRLLLPGLGTGNLYAGTRRYCTKGKNWYVPEFEYPQPQCVGVEQDPSLIGAFQMRRQSDSIDVRHADFLRNPPTGKFDWVLANPPYCRYQNIPVDKRELYAEEFTVAQGQFPLYAPFIEQSLRLLKAGGWATFILPIKSLTLPSLEPLQEYLNSFYIGCIYYLPAQTFNRKVNTIILSLQKEPSETSDGFWLETAVTYTIKPLLKRLRVDDVEQAADQYYRELKIHHARLTGRQGAFLRAVCEDVDAEESVELTTEKSGQTDLTAWN